MPKWKIADRWLQNYPTQPGCYAIYLLSPFRFRSRLIYIGTASNLKKRILTHSITARVDFWYAKCKPIKGEKRFKLEKNMIRKLSPILNKQYAKKT